LFQHEKLCALNRLRLIFFLLMFASETIDKFHHKEKSESDEHKVQKRLEEKSVLYFCITEESYGKI
jgi:hypothetical protein